MKDLAIDVREWGRFPMKRLFDYLENYYRAGYRELPEKIFINYDQRVYLIQQIGDYGQPVIRVEHLDMEKRDWEGKAVKTLLKLDTPFKDMTVEVIGNYAPYEA